MSQESIQTGNGPSPEETESRAAHDAAMIAKADGITISDTVLNDDGSKSTAHQDAGETAPDGEAPAPEGDRPGWLPEKFKSPEDLAKAYSELEKKLGAGEKPPEAPKEGDAPTPGKTAFDAATQEFDEKGELSTETYDALAKAGVTRETVDAYIAGQQALAQSVVSRAHSATGGEDNYQKMISWASDNLSDSEIAAYDRAVADPSSLDATVKGLYARFQLEAGFEPGKSVGGKTPGRAGSGEAFRSRHEMQRAMMDDRYTKGDTAFHAEVQEKMRNAMAQGIDLFA